MPDRGHRRKVLVIGIGKDGATREQLIQTFFILAAETQQVVVTKLIDRDGQQTLILLAQLMASITSE